MSENLVIVEPAAVAALSDEELNKACAERVMEWEYIAQGCGWYARKGDGYAYQCAAFSPATSLADAAMCTEAMIEAGWTIEITLYKKIGCSCTIWRFSERSLKGLDLETAEMFDTREKQQDRYAVRAATEPLARAEAALLACGKEEG
jgi:hypothetical protein